MTDDISTRIKAMAMSLFGAPAQASVHDALTTIERAVAKLVAPVVARFRDLTDDEFAALTAGEQREAYRDLREHHIAETRALYAMARGNTRWTRIDGVAANEIPDALAEATGLAHEPGWTGAFTRRQAAGAWPNGTRVTKATHKPGDATAKGTHGTILGSLIGQPGTEIDGVILYFIEWDDKPRTAVATVDEHGRLVVCE